MAGKRDSRRHSATGLSESVVVAGTSYQTLKVLSCKTVKMMRSMYERYTVFKSNRVFMSNLVRSIYETKVEDFQAKSRPKDGCKV